MPEQKPTKRDWREVAAEMCKQTDSDRIMELCEELTEVLKEEHKQSLMLPDFEGKNNA